MLEIYCILALLMSSISLIVALVGAVFTLRIGKGLTVHVVTTQPSAPPVPSAKEIAAKVAQLQVEADKATKESEHRTGFDELLAGINDIMLGGVSHE